VPFSLKVFTSIVYKDLNLYNIISIILRKIVHGRHSFTVYLLGQSSSGVVNLCDGILEQSMGARNRVGIGLSYWPARLHRLAESIP
jgi:hypothetical protein